METILIAKQSLEILGGLVPGPTVATSVHRCASPIIGFLYLRFHICGLTSYRQYSTAVLTEKEKPTYEWTPAV